MTPRRCAFALFATALAASPVAFADSTVLHCGRLFDSRSGRIVEQRTIVIEDGRVKSVEAGYAPVPTSGADAKVAYHDLKTSTCLPGWTDLHVHLGSQSSPQSYSEGFRLDDVDYAFRSVGYAEKTLMAGFTSVRDLGGDVAPHLRDAITRAWSRTAHLRRRQVDRHHRRPRRSHQRLQRRCSRT